MEKTKEQRVVFWLAAIGILAIIITAVIQLSGNTENIIENTEVLKITSQDRTKGPNNAEVTIVEYSDFQCPFCKNTSEYLNKLHDEYPNDVRIVYRYFPLESIHPHAYAAALATEAAHVQGKFWEMHDLIFVNEGVWSGLNNPNGQFQEYAAELGLDTDKFKADLLNKTGSDKIEDDISSAKELNLRGTPSIFINGEQINNISSYQALEEQIKKYVE